MITRMDLLPPVTLEDFEGPFDLLLELARKKTVDLSEISLASITDEFMRYMKEHDIESELQGDFLVVASTLLLLKVRRMLPSLDPEEEEEISELTGRIRVYELYRAQAEHISIQWKSAPLFSAHFWGEEEKNTSIPDSFPSCTPDMIQEGMEAVIRNLPKPAHPRAHLTSHGRTLAECYDLLASRLRRVKRLVFQEAVRGTSKAEIAVSFLAVLEMARKQEVDLHQESAYAHLEVRKL